MAKRSSRKRSDIESEDSGSKKLWLIIGAIVIGVVGLGALIYFNQKPVEAINQVVRYPGQEREHNAALEYDFDPLPPVGGSHSPAWQNCGIYDEPVLPENAIHSMEHGAVWVAYQEDLPEDQVAMLRDEVQGKTFVLLSPYPNLQSPVIVSAWGLQMEADSAEDGRIAEFIDRYRVGPQTPERGAACTGGRRICGGRSMRWRV